MSSVLFIFPSRGLFRLTICSDCGHVFRSPESDVALVTYRLNKQTLELVDSETQKTYPYPDICPICGNNKILSTYGGVDELVEQLEQEFGVDVLRYDKTIGHKQKPTKHLAQYKLAVSTAFAVSTRLYSPHINYTSYNTIVVLKAEQLAAGIDYLTGEEVMRDVLQLMLHVDQNTEIIFDTSSLNAPLIEDIKQISLGQKSVFQVYEDFVSQEIDRRKEFGFPPFTNLLLLTSQESTSQKAKSIANSVYLEIKQRLIKIMPEVELLPPYSAKLLKRKNKYSYHVLIKFPRQYKHFNQLRTIVTETLLAYSMQARLNPRHLF